MNISNSTPFTTSALSLTDRHGAETLLVVVKGTWLINRDGTLSVAEEQVPVRFVPEYAGDPTSSSLIQDTDVVLEKPGTDCILLGNAWAPKVGIGSVDVTFAVGAVSKTVRVFGERIWMKCLGIVSMSRPAPFEKIPLSWERAFGGVDTSWPSQKEHEFCLENPVGRGLLARKSKMEIDGLRLPNLENPAHLLKKPTDRPRPAGVGPIPPHWQPRAGFAGTYDDQWRKFVSPLPPDDLDPRFYSSAAPSLATSQHLTGREQVLVDNASRTGRLLFDLPDIMPQVKVRLGRIDETLAIRLDTVIVEPDEERVVLVWRGRLNVHGKVHEVKEVRVDLSDR